MVFKGLEIRQEATRSPQHQGDSCWVSRGKEEVWNSKRRELRIKGDNNLLCLGCPGWLRSALSKLVFLAQHTLSFSLRQASLEQLHPLLPSSHSHEEWCLFSIPCASSPLCKNVGLNSLGSFSDPPPRYDRSRD